MFDPADQSVPLDEIRSYLTGRYESRFDINPKVFEDVVASVYRDLGYRTRITGRTGDGGIDIVLERSDGSMIGVQVKRHGNSVKVEQIRAFYGALVLNGLTEGIFVSTSPYQKGAMTTAGRFASFGVQINLVDAPRFYDALGIAQQKQFTKMVSAAPFANAPLIDIPDSTQ